MADRKQELEALRDELIDRFDRYKAHKEQRGGPLDKDMEDQSIELQNDDVIEALQQEAEDELRQVMHALARIDEGEGDRCEECGESIDARRLAAVPYTTVCRDCAELR
ncbi:TraR/DksA family transcriptional regulator [Halomonas rhizosphaerae]|uniref:TraR/DksA family transcriptional regulator n=1 Tax=Halomonas rhizosphaerae TaxID=3043296 RepID=A0ABT6V4E5_9GAMM|nr:TraR/DksA family transcriptional regulator [Halomonas rhizosphaerae]MDI5893095.1 TraR/DksA family transcriptional regulator [Halomonas rhizosphaerae]MDI5922951.1 TraR/DksA family transcriptional regulator [Halomonas rhizosphaerae]